MKLSGEITTNCACVDEDGVEFYNEYCDGTCYEYALEDFAQVVEPLLKSTEYFKVNGIRLWDSTVGGIAKCETAQDLVRAMSVDGQFILRWEFDDETNALEARLSHHDCPTGCRVTVEQADETQYV
jgi:hypothetical protein